MSKAAIERITLRDAPFDLRVALAMLTVLPVALDHERAGRRLGVAAWAYPIVGGLVGLVGAVVGVGAWLLGAPPLASAALALAAQTAATGGLHEDGWADCADGLGAPGRTPVERRAIMRDSRIGATGAVALVGLLLTKAACAAALLDQAGAGVTMAALTAAGALSRIAPAALLAALPPSSSEGLGARAAGAGMGAAGGAAVVGIGAAAAAVMAAGVSWGVLAPAIGGAAIVLTGLGWIAWRRLGGQSGDVLGAAVAGVEAAALLAFSAWAAPGAGA